MPSKLCTPIAALDAADFAGSVVGQPDIVTVSQNGFGTGSVNKDHPARRFLHALFGAKPADLFILMWLLRGKTSHWFDDLDKATAYVERHHEQDVYVGVALSVTDNGPYNRCKAEDAAGLVGLWADLDIFSEAHKKQNLPPTLEDALSLIPEDVQPSVLVHSGHGVQAWWLFQEPRLFANAEDRAQATVLADHLKAFFRHRAGARGWDVDAVADFARVLRVPGTTNTKIAADHRPVELLEVNARRYRPEELREYLDAAGVVLKAPVTKPAAAGAPRPAPNTAFTLDPHAEPPFEKFDLLCEVEPRFKASWDHERPDLQDKSPSAYDQSLANFAAKVRWTDQEIVNLMVAHRRKYGHDLKLRVDYYRRTIDNARANAAEYWAEKEADQVLEELSREPGDGNDGSANDAVEDVDGDDDPDGAPTDEGSDTASEVQDPGSGPQEARGGAEKGSGSGGLG